METTGKADTSIGLITVFNNKFGMDLPKGGFLKTITIQELRALQERHRNQKVIFLDECSMLHQKHLYLLHRRINQIKCNDALFLEVSMLSF